MPNVGLYFNRINTRTSLWKTWLIILPRNVKNRTIMCKGKQCWILEMFQLMESILHDSRCTMRRQYASVLKRSRFKIISEYEAYNCQAITVTNHLLFVFATILFTCWVNMYWAPMSNVILQALGMMCWKGRHGPYPLQCGKEQYRGNNKYSMDWIP